MNQLISSIRNISDTARLGVHFHCGAVRNASKAVAEESRLHAGSHSGRNSASTAANSGRRSRSRNKASAGASGIAPGPHEPRKDRPEPSEAPTHLPGGATRNSASRCTFLPVEITVELAEQCVPVSLGPVGQVRHEIFDLLAGGFAEGPSATEIDSVGLNEVRIKLVMANQLAKAVANLRGAVVYIAIDGLRRKLL